MSAIKKYEDIIKALPGGYLVAESDGTISRVNEQVIETLGIPEDKVLGVSLVELLVPEFQEPVKKLLSEAKDKPLTLSVRLARALAPLELSVKALGDKHLIIGVRSMEREYQLSAKAAAELTHDPLTGLPDHYHVLSQLHSRINASHPKPLAIVCVWVDELPSLETSHGSRAVERVVQEVGERLQGCLRAPDTLGRFDKAGFLALLTSDAPTEQITDIAARLRSEIAFPVHFDKKLVSFTASVALASIIDSKPSIEKVLALLEASGTRAETNGGNRTDVLQL